MRANLKELLLYRYRYAFGYAILIFLTVSLAAWQLAEIPPGFSELEKQSAVASGQLDYRMASFVDLPYHLLQKTTLTFFGPNSLGIRLPSVLGALLSVGAIYLLLRRWFGESIGVIGALLTVTSAYVLLVARSGEPSVMYLLLPLLLLLSASMASLQEKGWRLWLGLFVVSAGLSFYTPYLFILTSIIVVVAVASRQGRGLLGDIGGPALALGVLGTLVLLLPLGFNIYENPGLALAYAGLSEAPSLGLILSRLTEVARGLVGYGVSSGFYPALSVPSFAFGLYGAYYTLSHTARSRYAVVVLWFLVALTIFVSVPGAPIVLLLVPAALLVIIGFWRYIQWWYGLFPRNPYARSAALLPIAALLLVMVQFNYQRYFYGLPHSETVRSEYDKDILLAAGAIDRSPRIDSMQIIVSREDQAFFSLLEPRRRLLSVVSVQDGDFSATSNDLIIAEDQMRLLSPADRLTLQERTPELVVDERPGEGALRFRVYR